MFELYYHPLASFCHKVLVALYEYSIPFEGKLVDLGSEADRSMLTDLWPLARMPVLRDGDRDVVVPETTIIIEYLHNQFSARGSLVPGDASTALEARLWDRFYDLHVQEPMQVHVLNSLRPDDDHDRLGLERATATLETAFRMIDHRMADRTWAAGSVFTMADCAAAPALFYARLVVPFPDDAVNLCGYFERLVSRTSVQRVLAEARPYFHMFPLRDRIPERFTTGDGS